jgi:6-phosphogluconolactonase (cycloisomerase 2 family)
MALALVLGGSGAALAKKQKFVYVHDRQFDGGIFAWSMDKNGGLTSVAGSPFPLVDPILNPANRCGGNCQTMAYSSKRKTLYTGGPTGVSAWTVNKDGTLTSVAGSPFLAGGGGDFLGTGVVEVGKRTFVYAASFDDGNVYGWEAQDDGTLLLLSAAPWPAGLGPDGLATRKKFVFVANEGDFDINVLSSISSYVAQKDGSLVAAPGSPFTPSNASFIYNTSPDLKGKVLYVDDGSNGVRTFTIDKKTAALSELGTPIVADTGGAGVLVTKKLAYVVGFEDGLLQPFKIIKKGALEATGSTFISPIPVDTFASDKSGKRMILAGFTGVVSATVVDKKTGQPGQLDLEGFLLETNPNAVVMLDR